MDEYEETTHGGGTAHCPECGGQMVEDDGDASMMHCEKCGYSMSAEDAKDQEEDEEDPTNE